MLIVYDHRHGGAVLQYGLFMQARDGWVRDPHNYEKHARLSDSYWIVPGTWDENASAEYDEKFSS